MVIMVLVCASIFSFGTSVHAQLTPQQAAQTNSQDISFGIDPEIPSAFQDVTITLTSYVTDLNRAYVSWSKDGKVVLSGTGDYKYTFTTGAVGQVTNISIVIALVSGEVINKQMSFNPADLDVVWEGADAYTPPFYRGRALPASEGYVRIYAIPQIQEGGDLLPQNGYLFTWKKDDQAMSSDSGYGKSAFLYQGDYLNNSNKIDVVAQNNSTGAEAKQEVTVPVFKPKILTYLRDPIYGVDWNHELGNSFTVGTADKTILAIPYFFSPANPLSNQLTYAWSINDNSIATPSVKNVLTLKSGDTKGVSNLKLQIQSINKLFLDAEKNISINLQ